MSETSRRVRAPSRRDGRGGRFPAAGTAGINPAAGNYQNGCPRKTSSAASAVARWGRSPSRRLLAWSVFGLLCFCVIGQARAQMTSGNPGLLELPAGIGGPEKWTSPEGLGSALQVMLLLTVLSLAPALLLMTTCFVRIIVVLGLLRQALGTQQLPPSQVITSIAMFMTFLIMMPVWTEVYDNAIAPYTSREIGLEEAWSRGVQPIRRFMSAQIKRTENEDDVWLFMAYVPDAPEPETYDDVPLRVLLPAFMLSELKTAFLIGFQIYLPFLILDMVVSSVMISMGMLMLPPVLISLPFKLLLFVLVDGWNLIVGMLLESFAPYT